MDIKQFIANLPHLPGVYRMLNARGNVLYVGKARDLKKRVSSYFQKTLTAPRTRLMISETTALEVTVTRSESEALLLENNLIKALAPRYNIIFRDDKSYPYIVLTRHAFPRLGFHRGERANGEQTFGPFPNAGRVRENINLLQKVFRLRTCEDSVFSNRSRPCLLHQIHRCSAPCVSLIDPETYRSDVDHAALFMRGKEQDTLDQLGAQMEQAAQALDFERAGVLRDQLQTLRKLQEKQFVSSIRETDADVIACVSANGLLCVNLVMVRHGQHLGDKSFFPSNAEAHDVETVIEAFVAQHYIGRPIPPLIYINVEFDAKLLCEMLTEQAGHRVTIRHRCVGEPRRWLTMATENAQQAITQRLTLETTQTLRLDALREALALEKAPQRIECFDISHTMGEATVASCVVYDQHRMQNGEYRRYNIRGITAGDDFAAMRDVLTRRYQKIAAGEGKIPDLIIIDGGKGQLGVALEVLRECNLERIAVIGLAKGEERKVGLEQIIFPPPRSALQLRSDHAALHLLQQIRDEAHRFAIAGHRAKRGKARTHSSLEAIEGIGARRRQRLLVRFGGLQGVIAASEEELAQVEGISAKLAEKIYRELH